MTLLDQVKRDHELLRSKLDLVNGALAVAPESWFVLREGCFALCRRLEEHCEREAQVADESTIQHDYKLLSLRLLNKVLLRRQPPGMLEDICRALHAVVDGLREELALQEEELFPQLERWIGIPEPERQGGPMSPALFTDDMTVHCVVMQHPETQAVFERCGINLSYEGYDCLDEVAWRRGMESRDLIAFLEEAIYAEVMTAQASGASGRN